MTPAMRPPASPEHDLSCLAALMQACQCEIYLINASSGRLVDANPAACANLQYERADLVGRLALDLAPSLGPAGLAALLAASDAGAAGDPSDTDCAGPAGAAGDTGDTDCAVAGDTGDTGGAVAMAAGDSGNTGNAGGAGGAGGVAAPTRAVELQRRDGTRYTLALRLRRAQRAGAALIVAVGEPARPDDGAAAAPNAPGLAYRFRLDPDGGVGFPYLSEGCQALLGLDPGALARQPRRFLELILPEDRKSYLDSMQASRAALWNWNWEGRIWIDAWKDVKWINLRSTPRLQADGAVQWEGVMSNITESRLEQSEVKQSRARLAELTAHIETVKEQERSRIAREIHDELGGNLSAIKMALARLTSRLAPDAAAPREKAAYVDALIDRSIDAVHRIALDLRPSVLDFGIVAALEWQIAEFERQAGVVCRFTSNRAEIALDPDHATALFRIAQEALTNIAKHARASRVTVRLARLRHHISLKITDNGGGIRQADRVKPGSFGLRGMAERASALGGTLTLGHAAGGGTVLTIKIGLGRQEPGIMAAGGAAPA